MDLSATQLGWIIKIIGWTATAATFVAFVKMSLAEITKTLGELKKQIEAGHTDLRREIEEARTEALRVAHAAHKRIDEFKAKAEAAELRHVAEYTHLNTMTENVLAEMGRIRDAVHLTRNELGARIVRVEDRLDMMKGHP